MTDNSIIDDIHKMYSKIDQCYSSKSQLNDQIEKEMADIANLEAFIKEDKERKENGKRTRYDIDSLFENIDRCKRNIALFRDTCVKEDNHIAKFHEMIGILKTDMERPKEIVIDMTGR